MKGDFTRFTFRPDKHYTRVLKQQGRVDVDADSNEQISIDQRRHQIAVLDLVGACAAPIDHPGFGLTVQNNTLVLSKGRCYVNGTLCENETDALPLTSQPDLPGFALPTAAGTYIVYLDVWERLATALDDSLLREVALGGPDTSVRAKLVWQVKFLPVAAGTSCTSAVKDWDTLTAPSSLRLAASAVASAVPPDPCIVPAKAGYRSLENQLYRVEIHDAVKGTFKWSRDNGTVVTQWLGTNNNDLQVSSAGRDATLGFAAQQWVELMDDTSELLGKPGTLVRLVKAQGTALTIDPSTATGSVNRADFPLNPKIRRWDSAGAIPITTASPIPLENGVQVQFTAGSVRTGDYWTIPARTITGNVEWPQQAGNPAALPPHGILHSYGRIAVAVFDGAKWASPPQDCRRIFGLIGGSTEPGIRITGLTALTTHNQPTTLGNDTNVPASSIAGGIDIQCDGPVAPESANRATCFVVLETVLLTQALTNVAAATPSAAYQLITLAADVSVNGNTIQWRPRPSAACVLHSLGRAKPPAGDRGTLARLILKGNFILGQGTSSLNLDGEAFGVSTGGSIAISYPSGDGHRGGDFHSWFYLVADPVTAPPPQAQPLTLAPSAMPSIARVEGIAELMADLVIVAAGGTPTAAGANVPLINLTLTFAQTVTSRMAGNFPEVVMRVDEPRALNVANIDGTTTAPPQGLGGEGFDYQNGCTPNIFRPSYAANQLTFTNIPLDPPPAGATRVLRISNIRLDASLLPPTAPASMVVNIASTLPVTTQQVTLAFTQRGLAEFTVRDNNNQPSSTLSFPASSLNNALIQNPATPARINFHVHFTEGFATAFKNQAQESGFLDSLVTEIVPVSNGTMLRATFASVPPGLQLYVTTHEVMPGSTPGTAPKTRLVSLSVNGAIVVNEVKPTGVTVDNYPIALVPPIPATAGAAPLVAIWEWIDPDPQSLTRVDEVSFGVVLAAANNQVNGTMTLQGALAPVNLTHTTAPMPVPRFIDSPVPMPNVRNAVTITAG